MGFTEYTLLASTTHKDKVLNATADDLGAGTYLGFVLDNTGNSSKSYLKVYDSASPTLGTTEPAMVIMVPASSKVPVISGTNALGKVFTTGYSVVGLTTGGLAGSTSPTNAFIGDFYES